MNFFRKICLKKVLDTIYSIRRAFGDYPALMRGEFLPKGSGEMGSIGDLKGLVISSVR